MAIYRGPACKLCRREAAKLFLKGDRCYTDKCSMERRSYIPGQHGQSRRRSLSEYGRQLREKQKAKRIYGILETQFRRYFRIAAAYKGVTGDHLMRLLELRLDNIVYRMGFAPSRDAARQLVLHNHFLVNEKKVNIPSMQLRESDEVEVAAKSKELGVIHSALKNTGKREGPSWLAVDKVKLTGKVISLPERDQIGTPVQDQLIVELYSK
jgi:small subunit ribosomal protein S4